MNHEFETVAWVNDERGMARMQHVTVSYELDGYKPLGLWIYDSLGNDRTTEIAEAEYDLLYMKACDRTAEAIASMIEEKGDR